MVTILVASLGAFWVWETTLVLSPWAIPPRVQPFLVLAVSLALTWPDWRSAMAVSGVVGLLHVAVRDRVVGEAVRVQPRRIPTLP